MRKPYMLNRKVYKDIKRKDHQQMEAFLQSFYHSGYDDGYKDAQGLPEGKIKEVLLTVKGIGEKKADSIMTALKEALESEDGNEQ